MANAIKKSWPKRIWGWVWKGTLAFFASTILVVILYRWINPPLTFLQLSERMSCPDGCEYHHEWVDGDQISLNMKLAVVASEDNNFMKHDGFDWGAIEKARKYNETHEGKKRGASTISQQTAKNVFLWPSRSWIRKGFEVYFTFLIELFWPKERIMEVYLNVIEMGPCKFGVGAVAQDYFHTTAANLTKEQAALIAGSLPNPKKMNAGKPGGYLKKRQGQIVRLMGLIGYNYFERYGGKMDKASAEKEEKEVEKKIQQVAPEELPARSEEEEDNIPNENSEPQAPENTSEEQPKEPSASETQPPTEEKLPE
jgi:monofunctional biosynthetic peptidoglycan transglycosylase